jgi:hypothetical protein
MFQPDSAPPHLFAAARFQPSALSRCPSRSSGRSSRWRIVSG